MSYRSYRRARYGVTRYVLPKLLNCPVPVSANSGKDVHTSTGGIDTDVPKVPKYQVPVLML